MKRQPTPYRIERYNHFLRGWTTYAVVYGRTEAREAYERLRQWYRDGDEDPDVFGGPILRMIRERDGDTAAMLRSVTVVSKAVESEIIYGGTR